MLKISDVILIFQNSYVNVLTSMYTIFMIYLGKSNIDSNTNGKETISILVGFMPFTCLPAWCLQSTLRGEASNGCNVWIIWRCHRCHTCCIPHQLGNFASIFIKNKGLGFDLLTTMCGECCRQALASFPSMLLSICLTQCWDGAPIWNHFTLHSWIIICLPPFWHPVQFSPLFIHWISLRNPCYHILMVV